MDEFLHVPPLRLPTPLDIHDRPTVPVLIEVPRHARPSSPVKATRLPIPAAYPATYPLSVVDVDLTDTFFSDYHLEHRSALGLEEDAEEMTAWWNAQRRRSLGIYVALALVACAIVCAAALLPRS